MNCSSRKVRKQFLEIIDGIATYDEFDNQLGKMNNKDKGNLFELFYKLYFTLIPTYRKIYKKVYLYRDIPTTMKENLGIPLKDKGIDKRLSHILRKIYKT